MKIMKSPWIFLAGSLSIFFACNQEPELIQKPPLFTEKKLPEPFHFQKGIEVKPGLTFDILSWGRGADSTSAFLILRSDSVHADFQSTSGDLEGDIADAWNMDMDSDGNPEIFIQTVQKNKPYLSIYVYEFNDSGSSQKLRFPDLTDATKKKYRGMDSIYVKDGKLRREFPLFNEDITNKKPEDKKIVEYDLSGNTFTVDEPEKE